MNIREICFEKIRATSNRVWYRKIYNQHFILKTTFLILMKSWFIYAKRNKQTDYQSQNFAELGYIQSTKKFEEKKFYLF